MRISKTEENYIKAIYKIAEREPSNVSTNAIAEKMQTKAASVTDMLKKLSEKGLVDYQKYKGVTLTSMGREIATDLIRKHRLWEVFLLEKLKFGWDEVHELAEELEHISSDKLVNRLDAFLDHPKFDPHGDPIPNIEGKFTIRTQTLLSDLSAGQSGEVIAVRQHSSAFLRHLNTIGIKLNTQIEVIERYEFDSSVEITVKGKTRLISSMVANNVFVRRNLV